MSIKKSETWEWNNWKISWSLTQKSNYENNSSIQKFKVIDGDTISINNISIRFSGIDAPESFFKGKKQTCKFESQKIFCGEISKKKLTQKIDNQIVKCFIEKSNDRYNRILAECFVNNESLSVYMVKNGYAFDYAKYSKKKYQEYENFAKKNKLGLWKTKFEYPWVWRKKNR